MWGLETNAVRKVLKEQYKYKMQHIIPVVLSELIGNRSIDPSLHVGLKSCIPSECM
ncbi:hypothetical protein Barb6_00209 [Bacteroidales bacterium Barb6]|nr:hypothetical protein Barb6_00209 [Bacteroidales bacterium Barb6]